MFGIGVKNYYVLIETFLCVYPEKEKKKKKLREKQKSASKGSEELT